MDYDEKVKCHTAWAEARAALIDSDATVSDDRLQRCLKYGSMSDMTDACWVNLLAAYPQD